MLVVVVVATLAGLAANIAAGVWARRQVEQARAVQDIVLGQLHDLIEREEAFSAKVTAGLGKLA